MVDQMHKPATLSDVARAAGVSRWVAGRVLNGGRGNSRVGAPTAERIREAAKRLTTTPTTPPCCCAAAARRPSD